MANKPALCTKCEGLIIVSTGNPFATCPLCNKNISSIECLEKIDKICADPAQTNEIIAKCLNVEKLYGPQIPSAVLANVATNFPLNEQVAFLIVRMNRYDTLLVKDYLTQFANDKNRVPFAEEFLTGALTIRNMEYISMFDDYVRSKLRKHRQNEFIELMRELKKSYVKVSTAPMVLWLLYTLYVVGGLVNLAMVGWFIASSLPLWAMALIATASIIIQIGCLYLHNRVFGNRYKMEPTEKLFMVIFLCTIVIATGGVFLGWLIRV